MMAAINSRARIGGDRWLFARRVCALQKKERRRRMQEGGRKKNKKRKENGKENEKEKKSRIFFFMKKKWCFIGDFRKKKFFSGRVKVEFGAFRVFIIPTLYFETWSSVGFKIKFLGIRF